MGWWVLRLARGLAGVLLTAGVVVLGIWGTAALALTALDGGKPRLALAGVFGAAFVGVLIFVRPHRWARLAAAGMVAAVAVWYFTIFPSNDRQWVPEHSRLATATIAGNLVTLHNYRVMEPGPDGKLVERYVDRTFDVSRITRADLIMSYWGPKRIAHALVSFEFSDGQYVAMSIEVRRRVSQKTFDMVSSLFRNFELIYVVGNERALIGGGILSPTHRLFLYRTNISPQRAQALFMRYVKKLNSLAAHPEWYNAITDNCTTGIYLHLREIPPPPAFNIFILLNGYLPEYIYEQGHLDSSIPWEELNRLCDIKETGLAAYDSPEFSKLIRERVPVPGGGVPR
jgi:hypothetical protein